MSYRPKKGDWIVEGRQLGRVLCSGPKAFDVIWVGGSTSRYPHGLRDITLATGKDLDERGPHTVENIRSNYEDALVERRTGARQRRAGGW